MLDRAIQIAAVAHKGQTDKAGEPYILHPLRVMFSRKTETERICAVLHDVVEDTHITIKDLKNEGFSEEVLLALDALTRRDSESYDDYISRVIENRIACHVKLADLSDNMDLSRIVNPSQKDYERMDRYRKASDRIIDALEEEGDSEFIAAQQESLKAKKIPIEDFFKMPQETAFRISPNGEYISYLKPYKKRLNIYIKSLENGEEERLTDCEDRNIAGYIFANDTRIVYMKDNGGDENYRLFAVDIDGGNFKEVAGFEGVTTAIIDELKNDNDHILIGMNKRNKQIFDVYKLNVNTGDMNIIAENPGAVSQWIVDNNGEVRAAVELDGVNTKVFYREADDSDFRLILEGDYKENAQPICFTEDNKNLIMASNINRDKYAIYEFDPVMKENIKFIYGNNEVDVESVITSKKTNKLICSSYFTEKLQYKFFNNDYEKIYNKIKARFADQCIAFIDIDSEENKIIIQAYSDRNPGVYYLYDARKDMLTEIAEMKPWINEEEMAEVRPIEYTSRDGLTIHGYLTIPQTDEIKNLPVVVIPHGGPWERNAWGFSGDAQFFANRGYAVLQINFRGSTGYGRKFKEAGFKQWGKAMQDDITDGVNWLIKEGIANKNMIAIYGVSYGGYATLAGLTFTPDLYTCGIDVSGPSNLFTLLKGLPAYWEPRRRIMYEMMGDPDVDKELLKEASPLFHVDNIKKPLFVAHGARDARVPQSEADQIVNALRTKNLEVKYMLKENEGHGYHNEENILEMYSEIEKFLEQMAAI